MTRSKPRGPQPRNNDIRHHLSDEQFLFLICGHDYFIQFDGPSFRDLDQAREAWAIHKDAVRARAFREYGPRKIWAEQQFDKETDR